MLPATKVVPKELVAVAGKPAGPWGGESIAASGIDDVIFVTSGGKSAVEAHFRPYPELEHLLASRGKQALLDGLRSLCERVRVRTAVQEHPRGLGDAVLCARAAVGDE